MRCLSSSGVPVGTITALEAWASSSERVRNEATVIDDLSEVPMLAALPEDRALPLRSLCAAPLVYRGRSLGLLVALANGTDGFLPHDVDLMQSYAAQGAIALTNARLYQAQEELATRDPLTGLLNHREFHEAVARELDMCRRGGGAVSVVLLDLDGFKQVNDTAGHAAGDRVLIAAGDALRSCCRDNDLAFRIGGDEFALVLHGTSANGAEPVTKRATAAIAGLDRRVGVSYGIGEWPADGPTKDSVLSSADERLYAMKRTARAKAVERAAASTSAGR